jgi:hypothetical protein
MCIILAKKKYILYVMKNELATNLCFLSFNFQRIFLPHYENQNKKFTDGSHFKEKSGKKLSRP